MVIPVTEQETEETTSTTALTDSASTDSTATIESNTDLETSTTTNSTDTTTATTTSTESEQTTAEIANDEAFDVDTIFTSGTFEIEGGGGNPKNSIFQGEVELAQMKMTKDRKSWSPEFWQASGSLGIDLNGLDISGTVDAAYYRAGAEVPESVLTLPDIGSSNVIDGSTTDDRTETTDTTQPVDSTDDTGSTEAVDSTSNKLILQKTPLPLKLQTDRC